MPNQLMCAQVFCFLNDAYACAHAQLSTGFIHLMRLFSNTSKYMNGRALHGREKLVSTFVCKENRKDTYLYIILLLCDSILSIEFHNLL